jgi:hypothetical protein
MKKEHFANEEKENISRLMKELEVDQRRLSQKNQKLTENVEHLVLRCEAISKQSEIA